MRIFRSTLGCSLILVLTLQSFVLQSLAEGRLAKYAELEDDIDERNIENSRIQSARKLVNDSKLADRRSRGRKYAYIDDTRERYKDDTNSISRSALQSEMPSAPTKSFECGSVPKLKRELGRSINMSKVNLDEGRSRIIFGDPTFADEFPFAVFLFEQSLSSLCSGVLVGPSWVLSAGHCSVFDASDTIAYFSPREISRKEETSVFSSKINKIVLHPENKGLINDVALFKLETKVPLSDWVQPACLVSTRDTVKYAEGKRCFALGYGLTENALAPKTLMRLPISIRQASECNQQQNADVHLNPKTICVGPIKGRLGTTCLGDSGGADVCYEEQTDRWVLVGTTSYGKKVCGGDLDGNWLSVSSDIAHFRHWIVNTTSA